MQPTEESLKSLAQCFLQTLAPDPEPRKQAENFLKTASGQPGFGITVLALIATPGVEEQVLQPAAVNFKNFVKYHWAPSEHDPLGHVPIQDDEKAKIKEHIVPLMLSAPPKIQAQISEALSIISTHDFPAKWENLLPELVSKLPSTDYGVLLGILETANSIFKRFRHQFKSVQLYAELKYCLDLFVAPMLALFISTGQLIAANQDKLDTLRVLLNCQRLICRIFFSLNSQELPEVFEDHLQEWMGEFHKYLTYENPLLNEKDPEKEGILDQLKAAICENINLYMEKNEEEFKDFLPTFVTDVWTLLIKLPQSPEGLGPGRDRLAIVAIRFLTTVSRSVHHALFKDPDTLRKICEGIVLPNSRLRDEDEELFEMNFVEYIRRDMEGSDSDTRRRMACELVKGLSTSYEAEVTHLFSQYVNSELAQYAANPEANWKAKDTAVFLVVALAVKQKTAAAGATATNNLVNLGEFFSGQILPELRAADVNSQPVLKANALKFLTTFRGQIPKETCLELMPQLLRFVGAESNVVHSYAANAIERLLLTRDGGQLRFSGADVATFAEPLLRELFKALKMPDSQENQYVMKCLMRVVSATAAPVAILPLALPALVALLTAACRNPANPSFNHYAFEAVAALVRRAAAEDAPGQVPLCEAQVFPLLQLVLDADVHEFAPYAFQLLALLIESRSAPPLLPLPAAYMALFPALISPTLWERAGNVPALVRLLQAYLQKASKEIVGGGQVPPVLGVFQKLIASKHSDHQGFFILNTVVEHLDHAALAPFVPTIWNLLFYRLQNSRTPKFVRGLLIFLSLFLVKHGVAPVVASVNAVQPGLFLQITAGVWAPGLPSICDAVETKLCAVAATDVLCECSELQADSALPTWARLLDAVLTLLVQPREQREAAQAEEPDVPDAEEITSGYAASYAQLHHAGKTEEDPVKDKTNDARQYLTVGLGALTARSPGRFGAVIQQGVSDANREALAQFCAGYGVTLA
ncbi:unnamed protein product [Closterium sp. NIES-53]